MKIKLISQEQFETIQNIQKEFSILTFNNKGYEYINKSKFTEQDKEAYDKVFNILKDHVVGFTNFDNFRLKDNKIEIRLHYYYDSSFIGVGYILLEELLYGFK